MTPVEKELREDIAKLRERVAVLESQAKPVNTFLQFGRPKQTPAWNVGTPITLHNFGQFTTTEANS